MGVSANELLSMFNQLSDQARQSAFNYISFLLNQNPQNPPYSQNEESNQEIISHVWFREMIAFCSNYNNIDQFVVAQFYTRINILHGVKGKTWVAEVKENIGTYDEVAELITNILKEKRNPQPQNNLLQRTLSNLGNKHTSQSENYKYGYGFSANKLNDNHVQQRVEPFPAWIVLELKDEINHFRNDLLRLIPSKFNGDGCQIRVKSSLKETIIPLSSFHGDQSALLEWIKANKVIGGMFLSDRIKSMILVAPNSDINELRTYIKEYYERKRLVIEQKKQGKSKLDLNSTRTHSTNSMDDWHTGPIYHEVASSPDDPYWENEQMSLQDAIDDWENNLGHNLSTYDDTDDLRPIR